MACDTPPNNWEERIQLQGEPSNAMASQATTQEDATPTAFQPNSSQDDLFDTQSEAGEVSIITDDEDDDLSTPIINQPTQADDGADDGAEESPSSHAEGNEDTSTSHVGATRDALTPFVEGSQYYSNEDASTSRVGGTGDALAPPAESSQDWQALNSEAEESQCSASSTTRERLYPTVGAAKRTGVSDSEDELAMSGDSRAFGNKTPRLSTSPLTVTWPVNSKVRRAKKGKKLALRPCYNL